MSEGGRAEDGSKFVPGRTHGRPDGSRLSPGRAEREEPPPIIVHSLDQALAAAAVGLPLTLRSAPGAAGYAGVGWFAALTAILSERHPTLPATLILDCADEAGTAMGALRRGIRHIRFTGPPEIAAKLVAIGAILDTDTRPALDLLGNTDPEAACRRWLSGADG